MPPTYDPPHSAATVALAKRASYSPSIELVLTYPDRRSFMNEKDKLKRHLLRQARNYGPALPLFVERVLKDAESRIRKAGQMERWYSRNKTEEEKEAHPEWSRLCYYMDKVVVREELAEKQLDTLLGDVIQWETHHPLNAFNDWNTFFLIARLIRHLHERLMKYYRSELGHPSSEPPPFEDTVIGVVFRIFLEMDVMSSPDETSLKQTLRSLDFVLGPDSIRARRRSKEFIAAASRYPMSPCLVPPRDVRWMKPRWTVPEDDTEVDRPEDLQLFIDLYDRPPCLQEFAAPVEAVVLYTLEEAHMHGMAGVEPEYLWDAAGRTYRVDEVQGEVYIRPCSPPPHRRQQPSSAHPPRRTSRRGDTRSVPPHPYAAPPQSTPKRRRRRQPRQHSAH